MSEEVAAASHDLDYWRRRAEHAEAHRDATFEAEVDALLSTMNVVEVDAARARLNDTLIPALAKMLTLLLIKDDGALYNYVEWDVGALPEFGPLRLSLARLEGKTAADLYREAKVDRDQALADAAALRSAILAYTTSATIDDRARLAGELYDLASASDAGAALLAERTALLARNFMAQAALQGAAAYLTTEQLGGQDVKQVIAQLQADADQLEAMVMAGHALATAVEWHHMASRAAERDPARRADLAAAAYKLGESLAAWRQAHRKADQ